MLKRIRVRNFRILNEIEIDRIGRINLIAGLNNSGKTSLLEAIFLLTGAGNPQLVLNTSVVRGLASESGMLAATGEPWREIFSELDMSRAIEITCQHDPLGMLALTIASERPHTTEIPLDLNGGIPITNYHERQALAFQYSGPEDTRIEGRIHTKAQGIEVSQPVTNIPFKATILSSRSGNIREDAVRLGMLRKQKRGHLLLEALRVVEPDLQSIEDSSATGTPMIWGDVGLSELIPLPVMGEGMTRIARLVLGISSAPDGVVLVDEIENGLHHSLLPKVWQVVDTAARQFRTQVFATTHSLENITAAHESLDTDVFRLHRLEITDSANRCVTYESESISSAIRHDIEVR